MMIVLCSTVLSDELESYHVFHATTVPESVKLHPSHGLKRMFNIDL